MLWAALGPDNAEQPVLVRGVAGRGTVVNDQVISEVTRLIDGDRLQIGLHGKFRLRVAPRVRPLGSPSPSREPAG